MDIIREKNIKEFLNLKNTELFNYYRQAPKEIQCMLKNMFNICVRFNLNNNQTLYVIQEAIKPFKHEILCEIFKEGDDYKCHGKVKHKEDGEIVSLV